MVNFRVGLWLALILSGLFLPTAKAQPQVWIEGNQAFSQSDLGSYLRNRQIDLSLLANSADTDLQRARRLLEQFYRDRGFPLARVWLNPKPYNSRFGMNEGPRAELGEIRFRGNSRFAEKTLRQLFSGGDRLDFNELEADLEKVRALYRNWGYPRVHVGTPEVEVVERTQKDHFPLPFRDKSAPQADLTVPIREGPEFHVNRGAVPDGFPPEIPLPKPGDLYRESDLAELRNSITEYYFEMGKLLDGFQILEDFKDETATLDLMVLYKVLPELTVNRIEFRGNLRFPDSFYRRELPLQEEQALDPRLLQTSLRALAQVGVLEGISADDVEIVIDRQNLTADVTINLQEKDRHSVFFAFGPDSLGGVDASLFYSVANLLGLGRDPGSRSAGRVSHFGNCSQWRLSLPAWNQPAGQPCPARLSPPINLRTAWSRKSDSGSLHQRCGRGGVEHSLSDSGRADSGIRCRLGADPKPLSSSTLHTHSDLAAGPPQWERHLFGIPAQQPGLFLRCRIGCLHYPNRLFLSALF